MGAEPCLENGVVLVEARLKRKRDGECLLGGGNDKRKDLGEKIYKLRLVNKIWISLIRVVRSCERKLGLAGSSKL